MSTYKSYITGFVLSVILTLSAYFAVVNHMFSSTALGIAIVALAFVQFIVQLVFFLHFGKGEDGSWNLLIFFSTVGIIFILVVGSIWIMNHLNYNMTPQDINNYMSSQDGI